MSILELVNISKSFGGIKAADHIDIGFEEGKISALIGPNGAGKSTIFNMIGGFLRPDEGTIYYKSKDITHLAPWTIFAMGIGRLFQDIRIFEQLTALDNVMVAFRNQIGENAFVSLFAPWKLAKQENLSRRKASEILDFVTIADKADDLAENLSYGQQKLLAIARLVAADTDLLLLDEPTAGINPERIASILDLIKRLKQSGKTIILIEHNMSVVFQIADWVYYIDDGQVVLTGLPDEVLNNQEIREAYIGV